MNRDRFTHQKEKQATTESQWVTIILKVMRVPPATHQTGQLGTAKGLECIVKINKKSSRANNEELQDE